MKWREKRIYPALIIIALIFFGIGYSAGYTSALNWGVGIFLKILEKNEINWTKTELVSDMIKYKREIQEKIELKGGS